MINKPSVNASRKKELQQDLICKAGDQFESSINNTRRDNKSRSMGAVCG